MTTTRFAPSPTGCLHVGHAFAAHVAKSRAAPGRFLLRFEDIDHGRVRPEYYAGIRNDLDWLGLSPDHETPTQLERSADHRAALEQLRDLGMLYPCFCTRKEVAAEIAAMEAAPQGPEGPHYPGTCRALPAAVRDERLARGEAAAWRLDSAKLGSMVAALTFHDQRHGTLAVDPSLLGDVVLARKDLGTSYHLAVVVDDATDGVTLVTRGEDLLPSTHVHRALQALLQLPEPDYLHHPLVTDDAGHRLAKRDHSRTIASYRQDGASPSDLWALFPKVS